jgi:phosphomannomutase
MSETSADLREAARTWMAEDPDPTTRAEVAQLLDRGDDAALAERFGTRLAFGTAGIRGPLGAGPNRMNRALVRRVTAGLAAVVQRAGGGAVVVARDGRHGSAAFAEDAVRVLAGAGLQVLAFPDVAPTPLAAYAVRRTGAAAGVVVTASHNPPADNGYKVYAGGGGQIVPPVDEEIAEAIDAVGPLSEVPLAEADAPSVRAVGPDLVDAYVEDVLRLVDPAAPRRLRIATTALHGVAGPLLVEVLGRAGFDDVHPVPEQQHPDPDFPTVAFPNPEEPGACDLVLALAQRVDADLVLANDPDGDRIAVGIPAPDGWRLLSGDEVGVLLAEDVLSRGALADGRPPTVGTTVVSSSLLAAVAAHHGAGYVETLTGFKWLAAAAADVEEAGGRLVLAYEQALGVSVGDVVRDKDGIGAALAVADLAARLQAADRSLQDLLDDLAWRHGAHATVGRSVDLAGAGAAGDDLVQSVLDRLRSAPPQTLGGSPVVEVWDHDAGVVRRADGAIDAIELPPTPLLRLVAEDGGRVMVRPSGTEPKLKLYGEAVEREVGGDPAAAVARARDAADALVAEVMGHAGLL